jgi:RNA recognition motif-containing protein
MNQMMNDKSYLDTKIGYFNKDLGCETIYVGNLSYDKDEIEIKQMFEEFGVVNYVKIIKDASTQKSKGIAFVQMLNRKHAKNAILKLNESEVDGRLLKVSIAEETNKENKASARKRRKPYRAYISKKDRGLEIN